MSANRLRGEASISLAGRKWHLRPSFKALVAAEEELGPLFALVERAADGGLKLHEVAALFWHCLTEGPIDRALFCEALAHAGLAALTPALRVLLGQILRGQ